MGRGLGLGLVLTIAAGLSLCNGADQPGLWVGNKWHALHLYLEAITHPGVLCYGSR